MNAWHVLYDHPTLHNEVVMIDVHRSDLEVIWHHICTGEDLPPVNVPLSINHDSFPSKDATIGIDSFIKFW